MEKQGFEPRKLVGYVLFGLLVALAGYFGVTLPEVPDEVPVAEREPSGPSDLAAVRERIGFDSQVDSYLYRGADLYVYSDNHSTQKLHIDGATGNIDSEGDGDFADDLVVADAADIGGNISSSTGAISMTDSVYITGTVTVGADGGGHDVTFYSDTAGDYVVWDSSAEALVLTGTNGQDALDVEDGNVDVADDIDVDGTANLDDVDIDGTLTFGSYAASWSDAITITGVLTNVRVLYYQVP